ncbi:hypothetical protein ACHAPU_000210 [Fusarium lateritium]
MDIEELLYEVSATVGHALEMEDITNPQTFVDMPDNNALPVEDITYRRLSSLLIPHPHIRGLSFLRFITFDGSVAYQPCHKDIDLLNVFDPLRAIEGTPDPIFQAAREWSCIIQAREGLPKDVR